METIGIALAFVGAALAVGLACSGSARGVGSVGEVGAGVLANDPGKFSQILILQIIPGTQGLYGLVAWFFALMKLGFFSGELRVLTGSEGLMFLAACLPMAIGGLLSAIAQGKCAAAGVALVSKRSEELSKAIIMAIMVEFYAILCLLASFLMPRMPRQRLRPSCLRRRNGRTKFWRSMRPRRGRRWNVFWRMGRERWTRTVPNCTAWHGWRRGNEFWQPSRM